MSIEDVMVAYKGLSREELERRLAHAECSLSSIASEGWQTSTIVEEEDFIMIREHAADYFHWVWERNE